MMETSQNYKGCLICKRRDRVYKISYNSGTYSTKDDIIEFMGPNVECMLDDDDVVCNSCMNIFDNIANLKRMIHSIICKQAANKHLPENKLENKPFKFSKIWASFLSSINVSLPPEYESHSPSPDLLIPTHSVSTDQLPESDIIAAQKKYQNLRKNSFYRSDTPYADKEIQEVFLQKNKKRRRRKSHHWTRKKGSNRAKSSVSLPRTAGIKNRKTRSACNLRHENLAQAQTETNSRPASTLSNSSYQSLYRPQSRLSATTECENGLRYKEGRLLNKRTRSVSRAQDEIASKLAMIESSTNKCTESPCGYILFRSLEDLTYHKVTVHNKMALYWCSECRTNYTSEEDLRKHSKANHNFLLTYCPICSEPQENIEQLQDHLREHTNHSVPCIYCDKHFLSRRLCEEHVKQNHKGKKKRIRQRRPQSILDRIVRDSDSDDGASEVPDTSKERQFTVRIRIQGNQGSESDNLENDPSSV